MALEPGTRLGPYEIVASLGAGGMGEVYRAHDERLDRDVAIKVLPEAVARDADRLARFEREAKAVAKLSHPNILEIYDFGREGDVSYSVTELLEGESLAGRLEDGQPGWRNAVEIGAAIADGLAAAHQAGIVHRDLKPSNVFLTLDGRVKILDFGIARTIETHEAGDTESPTVSRYTDPGVVLGTVGYMSPEQVRGTPADQRSDIFSLGSVLYEMLTGERAFVRETAAETMTAILKEEPPEIAATDKEIPPELERIVGHALEKRLEERFQSARDLAFDLRNVEGHSQPPGKNSRAGLHGFRRLRWVAAVGLVLVALAIVLAALDAGGLRDRLFRSSDSRGRIESLAILPFKNLGGDPETEYLAEELPASIINNLSRLEHLRVVPRESVSHYAARMADHYSLARELDVAAILTGRITVLGGHLSISAELVDVVNDRQIWGQRYAQELSDILSIEADISRRISEELRLRLSGEEKARLTRGYTDNAEAHLAYLQGRFWLNKRSREGYDKAIEFFDEAIRIDPDYALAYAGKADCYGLLAMFVLAPQDFIPKARQAAGRALAIDEDLAEAHTSMGWIGWTYDWDWEAAEESFQQAIRLNPRYPTARNWYAAFLAAVGRSDEAVEQIKRAHQLDPGSLIINRDLGVIYSWTGRPDLAIDQLLQTIEMDPLFAPAHAHLGRVYVQVGRYEDAVAELELACDLAGGVIHSGSLGQAYALAGRREAALRTLEMLTESAKHKEVAAYHFAVVHMGLGNKDEAFEWLDKSYANREFAIAILSVAETMGVLHDDPRFEALLRRVGLPVREARPPQR